MKGRADSDHDERLQQEKAPERRNLSPIEGEEVDRACQSEGNSKAEQGRARLAPPAVRNPNIAEGLVIGRVIENGLIVKSSQLAVGCGKLRLIDADPVAESMPDRAFRRRPSQCHLFKVHQMHREGASNARST